MVRKLDDFLCYKLYFNFSLSKYDADRALIIKDFEM